MPILPTLSKRSLLVLSLLPLACGGGSTPSAKVADDAPEVENDRRSGVSASSEIGGLNEEEVDAAFSSSVSGLQGCLDKGARRVEFLGGSVSFFLKIDTSGRVDHAHLERSTLGDRMTEKCMLDALRRKDWPKPVGGDHGLARKSFDFDPPNDVRAPADWSQEDAADGLKEVSEELTKCKDGKGSFQATLYVGTEGNVLAAGVTPPDETGEGSVDCLVSVLEAAKFPSPGSWPAKVTLDL
jgi:hypothetical protein